jgi:predicted Zn-dependent protease
VFCFFLAAMLFTRTALTPGWNLYTPQQDIQIGRQAAPLFEKQVTLAQDAQLNRYVANLGRKLVALAPYNKYPFTFKVVRDKNINAFALPGGPVYINTGTIEHAENESQLAGVIAHEIGHVVLRHSTNIASKAKVAKGGLALLGEVFGGSIVTAGAAFTLNSGFLRYSRENEKEADLLGAQILYDSKQWNPVEMARFFERVDRQTQDRTLEFFSDHPDPGNRVQLVSREVAGLGLPHRGATADSDFPRMQKFAAEIDRSAPAIVTEQVASLKAFNGRNYRISYPNNWQVSEQSHVVTLASPDSSYGAVVGSFDPGEGRSLEEATRRLVEKLRRENPEWRMGGAFQNVTVGGLPGQSAITEVGGGEVDWLLTALRPGGTLWYVVFIADQRDYARMHPVFQQMLDSVRLVN